MLDGGSMKSKNDVSWWSAIGLVSGAFHQIVSCPSRVLSQPDSSAANRPILSDKASLATVRSDFQALAMWRVTSGKLMPSRQYHSSG